MKLSFRILPVLVFAAACGGDGGTDPVVPAAITPASSVALSGTAGTAVADSVSVTVKGSDNKPMRNVQVAWAVTSGGGSVSSSSTTTNATGTAKVVWTLGTTAGENKLSATVSGVSPVVFTATGNAGAPASMAIVAGADQIGVVGSAVATPPAVAVKDAHGNAVAGTNVNFVAIAGGGLANGGLQTTNAAGIATVGGWKLGPTAGVQTMVASAGPATARIDATALAGAPAQMTIAAGPSASTRAAAGATVNTAPAVVVKDEFGNVVSGAAVTFAVTRGGGTITGASATSDANGIARVGSWKVGDAGGLNMLEATSGTGTVTFFANSVAAPRPGFNIDLHFTVLPTPSQLAAVDAAVARWSSVITGDVSNFSANQTCGGVSINEVVDDVMIVINFGDIDGPGDILGQAGPCYIRTSNDLPFFGQLRLDNADLQTMETQGLMAPVIVHEMGHILGIGTLWCITSNDCKESEHIEGRTGDDPYFIGTNTRNAFAESGGAVYTGIPVPVENCVGVPCGGDGSGTRDAHWRETVLQNELMTGFIDAGSNPLSIVTIESLRDLGYAVNRSVADSYTVPTPSGGNAAAAIVQSFELRELNHAIPLYRVDPDGRMHRIR